MVDTKKLEEVAARLNKDSDSLNKTLQKLQDKINAYNIGLEVWLDKTSILSEELPSVGDNSRTAETYLGYSRTQKGWGFAIQTKETLWRRHQTGEWENLGDEVVDSPQPLLQASREVRIAALEHLPTLIEELEEEAEEAIAAIDKAKKLADEI